MKDIRNTWKGIKSTLFLKTKESQSPTIIKIKHGETITDPKLIVDNALFFLFSKPISPIKN